MVKLHCGRVVKQLIDNMKGTVGDRITVCIEGGNNSTKEEIKDDNSSYQLPQQQKHHGSRRKKRRSSKKHEAIRFLQRFVFLVVLIDGFLAVSDCNLYGTLFFYLTLSSTFEVKPENMMDIYCYYAPVGNAMCQSYMARLTGYTPLPTYLPPNHYFRNGGGSGYTSTNSNADNNSSTAPAVSSPLIDSGIISLPRMSDEESFQLFLIYNQSFYETPAKFRLEKKIDRNSKLSKLYMQLLFFLYENGLATHNTSDSSDKSSAFNISVPLPTELHVFNSFHQSIEVISSAAPHLTTDIPQVIAAKGRISFLKQMKKKNLENKDFHGMLLPKSKESRKYFVLDDGQNVPLKNKRWNMLQSKDFSRHRWKRNIRAFSAISTSSSPTPTTESVGSKISTEEKPQILFPSVKVFQLASGRKMSLGETKISLHSQQKQQQQQNKHELTHPPAIFKGKAFSLTTTSTNMDDGENDSKPSIMGNGVMSGGTTGRKRTREVATLIKMEEGSTSTAFHHKSGEIHENLISFSPTTTASVPSFQPSFSTGQPADEKNSAKKSTSTPPHYIKRGKASGTEISSNKNLEMIIATAEANLIAFTDMMNKNAKPKSTVHITNSSLLYRGSPGGPASQVRKKNQKSKELQELYTKLERNPRNLIGLIESSLFNNWLCFSKMVKLRLEYPNVDFDERGWKCGDPKPSSAQIQREEKIRGNDNLVLNMEMDIISHETFKKAERRRRALEQIYHDYSNTILSDMRKIEEVQVSSKFEAVVFAIKLYTFAWHCTICTILLYGTVWENSTALHIWGLFNILTSLLHFMVDEWINATFQPEKTSAAIWFAVVYGVYKPIAILLVASLSSEMSKNSRRKDKKEFGKKLKKLVSNLKLPPPPKFMITDEMGTVRLISGDRSYDYQTCNIRNDDNTEQSGEQVDTKMELEAVANQGYVTLSKEGYISAITESGKSIAFKALTEVTDEESEYDDEIQLEMGEDDEEMTYSDAELEYVEEDEIPVVYEHSKYCCHTETEQERNLSTNVQSSGNFDCETSNVILSVNVKQQEVDYEKSGRLPCSPLSREDGINHPVVDGGNVHI